MATEQGKMITITSVKGGTGKTSTVLSLAGIYSLQQKKVLIIDLDFYASAVSAMLNIDSKDDIFRLADDLSNNRYTKFEDYIVKYNDYIDVLQAPKDPRLASKVDSNFLSLIFNKSILKYDIVLVDTNHFLNDINLIAFDNSDTLLYVLTNDVIDMKNMKTMVSIFKDMDKTNYRILLNSSVAKGRNKYSKYDIKSFIKHDIDYHISDNFYIKDIDSYLEKGQIPTLDKKIRKSNKKSISDYEYIASDLLIKK